MKYIRLLLIAGLLLVLHQVLFFAGVFLSFKSTLQKTFPEGFSIDFSNAGLIINGEVYSVDKMALSANFIYVFILLFLVVILAFVFYKKEDLFLQWNKPRLKNTGIIVSLFITFQVLNYLIVNYFGESVFECENCNMFLSTGMNQNIWTILTIGILIPIVEEFIFRGYLYTYIGKYLPAIFPIIITAVLFTLIHPQPNAINYLLLFPPALMFSYSRHLTKSIWLGIILHIINNLYAVAIN